MFSVARRILLFWIVLGLTRASTSLQSLLGAVSESPRSSTIGCDGWLLNAIVLRNWFLPGPSIDSVRVGAPRPPMNSSMLLFVGLVIQIQESELRGRRAKDWPSSSLLVEPCWFWMAWSRSKIPLAHKKDDYVSLPSRPFCVSLRLSIPGFV